MGGFDFLIRRMIFALMRRKAKKKNSVILPVPFHFTYILNYVYSSHTYTIHALTMDISLLLKGFFSTMGETPPLYVNKSLLIVFVDMQFDLPVL
jgi:hypothetical protein